MVHEFTCLLYFFVDIIFLFLTKTSRSNTWRPCKFCTLHKIANDIKSFLDIITLLADEQDRLVRFRCRKYSF